MLKCILSFLCKFFYKKSDSSEIDQQCDFNCELKIIKENQTGIMSDSNNDPMPRKIRCVAKTVSENKDELKEVQFELKIFEVKKHLKPVEFHVYGDLYWSTDRQSTVKLACYDRIHDSFKIEVTTQDNEIIDHTDPNSKDSLYHLYAKYMDEKNEFKPCDYECEFDWMDVSNPQKEGLEPFYGLIYFEVELAGHEDLKYPLLRKCLWKDDHLIVFAVENDPYISQIMDDYNLLFFTGNYGLTQL